MLTRKITRIVAVGLICAGATACGDDASNDEATATTEAPSTTEASATTAADSMGKELSIEGAWARNSPMAATAGAAYFTITGGEADDVLTGVKPDTAIAGSIEMHETVMAEGEEDSMSGGMSSTTMANDMTATTMADDMTATTMDGAMTSDTMAGAMQMRPVKSIDIPAGEKVELKPGGYHIMLIDLVEPLKLGDTFDLTLMFEKAGEKTVSVEVKEAP